MASFVYGNGEITTAQLAGTIRLVFPDGPLALSWKHSGMTADFVANIASLPYKQSRTYHWRVKHDIGYVANELIENAVKFRARGDVVVESRPAVDFFWLRVSNKLSADTALRFRSLLERITIGDPGELLLKQIEHNAMSGDNTSSLGLLTLMSDYDATLAWIFAEESYGLLDLTTYALLPMPTS
jgi:hypothetical protein